jgi:hypothetical protein
VKRKRRGQLVPAVPFPVPFPAPFPVPIPVRGLVGGMLGKVLPCALARSCIFLLCSARTPRAPARSSVNASWPGAPDAPCRSSAPIHTRVPAPARSPHYYDPSLVPCPCPAPVPCPCPALALSLSLSLALSLTGSRSPQRAGNQQCGEHRIHKLEVAVSHVYFSFRANYKKQNLNEILSGSLLKSELDPVLTFGPPKAPLTGEAEAASGGHQQPRCKNCVANFSLLDFQVDIPSAVRIDCLCPTLGPNSIVS